MFLVSFDLVLVDLLVDLVCLSCEIRILCSSCSIRIPQIGDFLPEEALGGTLPALRASVYAPGGTLA